MATTIMPTFHDIEVLASERACPPRITVRDMNPIKERQLNRPKMMAG